MHRQNSALVFSACTSRHAGLNTESTPMILRTYLPWAPPVACILNLYLPAAALLNLKSYAIAILSDFSRSSERRRRCALRPPYTTRPSTKLRRVKQCQTSRSQSIGPSGARLRSGDELSFHVPSVIEGSKRLGIWTRLSLAELS